MFQEFFEISSAGSRLFKGLAISQYEDIMENHCSKYPVINLSFKGAKQIDFNNSSLSLRRAISRESIFTGLNNLSIISILDTNYSENFGFTETEVKEMLGFVEANIIKYGVCFHKKSCLVKVKM